MAATEDAAPQNFDLCCFLRDIHDDVARHEDTLRQNGYTQLIMFQCATIQDLKDCGLPIAHARVILTAAAQGADGRNVESTEMDVDAQIQAAFQKGFDTGTRLSDLPTLDVTGCRQADQMSIQRGFFPQLFSDFPISQKNQKTWCTSVWRDGDTELMKYGDVKMAWAKVNSPFVFERCSKDIELDGSARSLLGRWCGIGNIRGQYPNMMMMRPGPDGRGTSPKRRTSRVASSRSSGSEVSVQDMQLTLSFGLELKSPLWVLKRCTEPREPKPEAVVDAAPVFGKSWKEIQPAMKKMLDIRPRDDPSNFRDSTVAYWPAWIQAELQLFSLLFLHEDVPPILLLTAFEPSEISLVFWLTDVEVKVKVEERKDAENVEDAEDAKDEGAMDLDVGREICVCVAPIKFACMREFANRCFMSTRFEWFPDSDYRPKSLQDLSMALI